MKKALWVIAAILAIFIALYLLSQGASPVESAEASTSWGWILIPAGIAAAIGLIALLLWKGPSMGSDKIAGTFWVIAALLFLEFALWKYVPQAKPMFEGMGLLHIPIYIIAIIIFAGLESTTKGRQYAFGVVALVVALAIIGLNHFDLTETRTRLPVWMGGTPIASKCANKKLVTQVISGSEWTEFNPDGCDTQYAVTEGVVLLDGPGLLEPVRVVAGDYSKNLVAYAKYTRAKPEGARATLWHMECEELKIVIGEWKCRS